MSQRLPPREPELSFVEFLVGTVRYALPVSVVRQVLNPLALTTLPHTLASVLGVANHRGELIPVVDVRRHFGVTVDGTRKSKWLIVQDNATSVAMIVDAVTGVFRAYRENIRPVPRLGTGDDKRALDGVIERNGVVTFILLPGSMSRLARPVLGILPEPGSIVDGSDDTVY